MSSPNDSLRRVFCDRQKHWVDGYTDPITGSSAGVYVTRDSYWSQFASPEEQIVCEECMWADPRYRSAYPNYPYRRTKEI